MGARGCNYLLIAFHLCYQISFLPAIRPNSSSTTVYGLSFAHMLSCSSDKEECDVLLLKAPHRKDKRKGYVCLGWRKDDYSHIVGNGKGEEVVIHDYTLLAMNGPLFYWQFPRQGSMRS